MFKFKKYIPEIQYGMQESSRFGKIPRRLDSFQAKEKEAHVKFCYFQTDVESHENNYAQISV